MGIRRDANVRARYYIPMLPNSDGSYKVFFGIFLVLFLVIAVLSFKGVSSTVNAAALSEAQIQSIISLLLAFKIDPEIVSNVEASLHGKALDIGPGNIASTTEANEIPPPAPTAATSSLIISVSSASDADTVPVGTVYVLVGSYRFDATASGEDISFSSLKFLYTDNALYDPYNCAIFSGPDEFMTRYKYSFNPDWVHPAGTDNYEFILTTPLVISKGTARTIDIRCNTNTNAIKGTGAFSWGISDIDGKALFTGIGVDSKEPVTPQVIPSVGSIKTFVSKAAQPQGNVAALFMAIYSWFR